jgi:aspartyl-tRNA(Asn)/glutamyl-tRNA(Gln) amidotransferase subunit B
MSAVRFEPVIGLEVHVQLATASKIFCRCRTAYGEAPNTQVCPVCLGHPGVLPVLNRQAVGFGVRWALAVGAHIPAESVFARKNYFYPDLPKGYQISQYEAPLSVGGAVPFRLDGEARRTRLVRAHLEEDAGKSFHPEDGREAATLIDLNRAGVPLLEVVSEPEIRSPGEAQALLERVHQLVTYLEICDGNLEEGSFRCDANVSVRPAGTSVLLPKTEIKNLNSFRNVHRALEFEVRRQTRVLESGDALVQATRLWDANEGRTRVMREKEEAHDYRYFPDPDLRPLRVPAAWIEEIRTTLPELPWDREERLAREYAISLDDARLLAGSRALADYFETAARAAGDGKAAASWVLTEVLRLYKLSPDGWPGVRVIAPALGKMVRMIRDDVISGKIGKAVFTEMAETGADPEAIVEARGYRPISDPAQLGRLVEEILTAHPGPVSDYLSGKAAALQFLMGQVMRRTDGRASPVLARQAVEEALKARRSAGGSPPEKDSA